MRAHMRNLMEHPGSLGAGHRQGYARFASRLAPPLTAAITQAGPAVTSANALDYQAALDHVSKNSQAARGRSSGLRWGTGKKTVAGALVGRHAGSAIRKLRLNRFLSPGLKKPQKPKKASTRFGEDPISIWLWLLVLVAAGLLASALPVPKIAVVVLVFGIAVVKATMVMRDYMHLKFETLIIYVIALIPILLFIGLALTLIPDIALHR